MQLLTTQNTAPNAPSTDLVPVHRPLDEHPAAVYLGRLGAGSRRVMRHSLDTVAGLLTNDQMDAHSLPWSQIRYQHTAAARAAVTERFAPSTANRILAALRGVLREAWRLGHMNAEDYHRAVDLAPVKGETLPAGREVTPGELGALFDVCAWEQSAGGARDAALLSLLYGCGLRRAEVVSLDFGDLNTETGELRVRHGKGSKQRIVYATNGAMIALSTWLEYRGSTPGPLLRPVNKGGKVQPRRMTGNAVTKALERRAAKAGVAEFTPHDMRRSFVSHLLDAGQDISTVQRLAGHANVATTQRYDRRGEAAKRQAAASIHVPYRGPRERPKHVRRRKPKTTVQ